MSLLMPEYERQLRAAARRMAGAGVAPARPARGPVGSRLLMAVTGAVAVAVALAAILLIGHRVAPRPIEPAAPLPAVQYDCAPHQVLRTRGRLVAVAHGTIAGHSWTVQADQGRRGFAAVQAGRLLLAGRAYGFCRTGLDIELVNAGPRGVVYGLAARVYEAPIVVEAAPAHPGSRPVPAHHYPATRQAVRGGVVFLRVLPASACAYRGLGVSAPERPISATANRAIIGLTGPYTHACAPGQLRRTVPQPTPPPAGSSQGPQPQPAG